METKTLQVPEIVVSRYTELCELLTDKSIDGARVAARDLANYLRVDVTYLRSIIHTGKLPYGFSPESGRAVSYIGVLPMFMYETQGVLTTMMNLQREEFDRREDKRSAFRQSDD